MAKQKQPRPQGGMNQVMQQMQRMQADMAAAQAALAETTVEGSAGGGKVTAVVTGTGELRSISIEPDVVDPDDVEMLEDLVAAAFNDAVNKANEESQKRMSQATAGMPLPPGMKLPGMF